jgi:hypothetical protein
MLSCNHGTSKHNPVCDMCPLHAGTGATAAAVPPAAAFKPSANASLFGNLPAVQPRSHAKSKLLTRPVSALHSAGHSAAISTASWSSQLQGQTDAGRFRLPGSGYPGAVQAGVGHLQNGSDRTEVPRASLPGAVSWQRFVSNHDAAAAAAAAASTTADAASKGFLPGAGLNTHPQVAKLPDLHAVGSFGSAQRLASSAAVGPPAPAVVPPQQHVGDTAPDGDDDDGLDLGDIFAFMK